MTATQVVHRRYVPFDRVHYHGNLVDGGYVLSLFGDAATDLLIHHDGDEGLFASYSEVTFHRPVHAGDVLEVAARIVSVGNRSRRVAFTAHVLASARPDLGPTAAQVEAEPRLAVSAEGTVVVPVGRPG